MKIRELPWNVFLFGNYDAGIPSDVYLDDERFFRWLCDESSRQIIGYSPNTAIKNRSYHVGVMILEDGNERWSHVPDMVFERLIAE